MKFGKRTAVSKGSLKLPALLIALIAMTFLATGALAQDNGIQFGTPGEPQTAQPAAIEASQEVIIPINRDTYVASNSPSVNFGSEATFRIGMVPSSSGAMRTLLYYDMQPFLPSTARITKAEVHIYLASVGPPGDSGRTYAAHGINQSWSEHGATWSAMPSYGGEIGRGNLGSSPGWRVTDITGLAQSWFSNPGGNHGVILIGDERPDQNFERAYTGKEAGSSTASILKVWYDDSQDTTPPTASVTSPAAGSWTASNYKVKWEGSDPNNPDGSPGSGIKWYDIYYSLDSANTWKIGKAQDTSTETDVHGASHLQRIDYYARARDNADNEGPEPSGPGSSQTWSRVDAEAPNTYVLGLPEYTPATSFTVSWTDTKEVNESGIQYFDVQYRVNGGPWQQFVYRTAVTSAQFTGAQNGSHYEFRARGVDNVGNVQDYSSGPQAGTIVWLEPIAFVNPFNPSVYQQKDGPDPGDGFVVSWGAHIPPGTSVVNFDVRYRRADSSTWIQWQTATTLTSDRFDLNVNDPDGTYIFQARALDSNGIQGSYREENQAGITVDRQAPFIEIRVYAPFIVDQTSDN